MWLRSAEANPGDVSKIGALSVLRKLADHLGLTSLTDHDLKVTCGTNGLVHVWLWWVLVCCSRSVMGAMGTA